MVSEMDGVVTIDRLKDHYKHCIRLSASNKINAKNAFDLQLIDYMQDLVSTTEDGQMNFKIASSALDVGAKIYSNRVDCIQSEAQKVATSILMALDDPQSSKSKKGNDLDGTQVEGNDSNASDRLDDSRNADEDGHKKESKKKRRTKNIKTITEEANLDGKLEQIVMGDAFLDGLSRDYDMSCPAALICYNALTQPNCLLTIESAFSRSNYKPKVTSSQSKKDSTPGETSHPKTLETITEEPEREQSSLASKELSKTAEDANGDCIMRDETEEQDISDKLASATDKASTVMTQTTSTAANTSISTTMPSNQILTNTMPNVSNEVQANFVTLITKHVNCARVIRDNINNKICPRLESFLFNDRTTSLSGLDRNNLDETIETIHDDRDKLNTSKVTGGAHEFNPELYDAGDDHFADAESIVGDGEAANLSGDGRENLIPNLDKIAASRPTDYGYSTEHHRLMNTWAGPHAWKSVKFPQTASKKQQDAPKSVRKRAKLEQMSIDFEEEFLATLEKIADKDIRHSADVIRRWKKPLFPQDHNLTEESVRANIIQKFLRPEDTYHCEKTPADAFKVVGKDHSYLGINDDHSDNNDDCLPSSPLGPGGFDDAHDDSDDEFRADPVVEGNEVAIYGAQINNPLTQQDDLEFAGEHLIEQPYTVAHVHIAFAKIAKKMDVRRLKRVMWDLLLPPEKRAELSLNMQVAAIAATENNNQERLNVSGDQMDVDTNDKTNEQSTLIGSEKNETVIMAHDQATDQTKKTPSPTPSESPVHLEFSNLYGELPVRISSKMATDLSQSIAFVTLLHLANEKNLKLIPKQDLKDFIIEQDEVL